MNTTIYCADHSATVVSNNQYDLQRGAGLATDTAMTDRRIMYGNSSFLQRLRRWLPGLISVSILSLGIIVLHKILHGIQFSDVSVHLP